MQDDKPTEGRLTEIDRLVDERREDREFMERLRARHERERALYARLA